MLLTVDTLIRRKTHRLNHDQRKSFPTFSSALLEMLTNHKQLWNDARSSAELDKFKQAGQQHPETPVRAPKRQLSDNDSPIAKPSSKAKRNKARRERHKVLLAKAKASSADNGSKPAGGKAHKDARVPAAEWDKITSFKYNGKRRCPFFTIVQWVAGLETRADMLMCVLSVARIILGTATTEQGISNPLQVCGSHLEGQNPSQKARIIMWLIHL